MNLLTIQIQDKYDFLHQLEFGLSTHCLKRLAQRGITHRMLSLCLLYGEEISRHGLNYYYMNDKNIPKSLLASLKGRLKGLVVVCDDRMGSIITVFHGYKGMIHIRKKRKAISKWN
jgi:hypothetical protein